MGGGDWNDGFDAMGESAESVWLTWFASGVFHDFSALLTKLGESGADRYETAAAALGAAANEAWDTDHYLRGYYADGTPLGASGAAACRIDSVAQSFAAFSPYADRDRVQMALTAALAGLRDRERRLIRIYAPAFLPEERAPGYVSTYGPGFRENGGQYTHAAVWLIAPGGGRKRPRSRRTWRSRSPRRSTARSRSSFRRISRTRPERKGARGGAGIRARQGGISDCCVSCTARSLEEKIHICAMNGGKNVLYCLCIFKGKEA